LSDGLTTRKPSWRKGYEWLAAVRVWRHLW